MLQNNKGLKTNKKNTEEHGLGIEHVKELVENIDGMFEVFEGMCCVTIRHSHGSSFR